MKISFTERRLPRTSLGSGSAVSAAYVRGPAFQAFAVLRAAFAALLVFSGARGFMHLAGLAEIGAGILVAVRPRWGAPLLGVCLLGVIGDLLLIPGYYDVALRDAGLAAAAFALFRLSEQYDR